MGWIFHSGCSGHEHTTVNKKELMVNMSWEYDEFNIHNKQEISPLFNCSLVCHPSVVLSIKSADCKAVVHMTQAATAETFTTQYE